MGRNESRPGTIGPINLVTKQAGAPSAGNPHAGCDVAGAGNGFTVWLLRHSQRKRGATARLDLRNTAPVLDPTGPHPATALAPPLGRKTPKPPNWLSRCRFSRIRNVKLPCVHVPLNSRIVGQQKAGREPSLGTSVRNERPVTHISSERDFCPLPFGSLASRCVFLSAYALFDWKRACGVQL